jgi:putative heme-binding domain-containing protein
MPSRSLVVLFAILLGGAFPRFAFADPNPIAWTEALTPDEEKKAFKLPPGFEAQLVACEPDILKPIQMAFDAKGRLWVTTTIEYPFPAVGRPGKDKLCILEDFGPDGKARKVSVFADELNIPIGVCPLPDCKSVLVSSVDPGNGKDVGPSCWIWKLTDTDGDGKADKREKLYGPFGVLDTHGMVNSFLLMPDGWVYACHGYRNTSRVKGTDGQELEMNSGNTFRFRPDGSHIEIWTRGQVNPFGMTIDPYFNIYNADCHSKPITQLIHGSTYESFGKPHDGLGFAPTMMDHIHNSTALCGVVYYAADHFPKEYLDCCFLGNVTANRINLDKIEFTGSTPRAVERPDFLVTGDMWFRPVDIKLGPDGALYVSDFYNKIIGHYEVDLKHPGRDKFRGRIWRIIWRGPDGKGDAPKMMADLTKAPIHNVHLAIGDQNLTVRMLATQQLIERSKEFEELASKETKEKGGYNVRYAAPDEGEAHSEWYNFRTAKTSQVSCLALNLRKFREHWSAIQIVHALRVAGAMPNWEEDKLLDDLTLVVPDCLAEESPIVKRAAVDALALHPDPAYTPHLQKLFELLQKTPASDTHLRHAARVALREELRDPKAWDAPSLRNLSDANARAVADVSLGIHSKEAGAFLAIHIGTEAVDRARLPDFLQHIARYGDKDTVAKLSALLPEKLPQAIPQQVAYLLAIQRGMQQRGEALSPELVKLAEAVAKRGVEGNDPGVFQPSIELAGALRLATLFEPLVQFARLSDRPEAQRGSALQALGAINAAKATPLLGKLLVDARAPIGLREKAAQVLAAINQPPAQAELVNALATAEARLATAIASGLAGSRRGAEQLLDAVEKGKASARLLQDRQVHQRLIESKLPKAAERLAALTNGLPSADQKIESLMKQRRQGFQTAKGDWQAGLQIYTKNCAICHQINSQGAKIGPQLDGIGGRGLDRLLEDILDPNRNVDQAMRQTTFSLKDGGVVSGLVLREEGQVIVVADQQGKEVRVEKENVDNRRTSMLSPMPANLGETIAEKDFYDLLAYLLTQRPKDGK